MSEAFKKYSVCGLKGHIYRREKVGCDNCDGQQTPVKIMLEFCQAKFAIARKNY